MRGRKPKPGARRLAEGDTRKVGASKLREQVAAEPKAARGLPPCPAHVTGKAAEAWEFWAIELADMNLDHRPDAMMLEGACVNYATAVKAGLEVAKLGEVFHEPILSDEKDPDTDKFKIIGVKQKKNLWVQVRDRSWMLVHRFATEFGLSPVSRARLSIEKKDDAADELARLLATPRERKPLSVQ